MDKRLAAPAVTETATLAPAVRPTTSATAPAAADKSDANRLALVKKVEVPATGNEVEDAYTYGFRLWDAKLYTEAEAQLKIGRASCRERVCQYVTISVDRASLKKKQSNTTL